MRFTDAWLDELRARVTLSGVIGRDVQLTRAGREHKACCPFHNEKSASFYVNDDKGFYHCFGCAAHGDAIRWLTDQRGLSFVEAVTDLAGEVGLDLPAETPQAAERARTIEGQRPTLEHANAIFRDQLSRYPAPALWLAQRGVTADDIATFEIGYAPEDGALRGKGFTERDLASVGLVGRSEGANGKPGFTYPRYRSRITFPIHDARGRIIGFGGRSLPGVAKDGAAKYINSSDSLIFDKSRTLFNLHRAREYYYGGPERAPAKGTRRLLLVEGYIDVIALQRIGAAATAPMGTALTAEQLTRAWRIDPCPLLLFDGDGAGQKAAVRACETALPMLGPGRMLAIASLPAGLDPDEMIKQASDMGEDPALAMAVACLAGLRRVDQLLFDTAVLDVDAPPATGDELAPEAVAAIWARLDEWARRIVDEETRLQYLATWRARYERMFVSALQPSAHPIEQRKAHLSGVWDEAHQYFWPDPMDEGERQLIRFLREKLSIRAERRALAERNRDLDAMAKVIGLHPQTLNKVAADIEADALNGSGAREEKEAMWALYRRVAGVAGPIETAILPQIVDGRAARSPSAAAKRISRVNAMIEGGV